jgi:putative membrane protein
VSAQAGPRSSEGTRVTAQEVATAAPEWQRLSARIVWVDLVISVLSVLPAFIVIWVFDLESGASQIWPLLGLAAFGVLGALLDLVRWIVTRFRMTDSHVELRTGIVVRQHRTIQRDRIRSVDVTAKLRHRVARLRVVTIGAGQQTAAGEAALPLDALSVDDARSLQQVLLRGPGATEEWAEPRPDEAVRDEPGPAEGERAEQGPAGASGTTHPTDEPIRVFARFEPTWFIYNMFNVWAFVMAIGLLWGALWLLDTVGIDLVGYTVGLVDWTALGWIGTALIAVVVVGALGAIGLGVVYFLENWNLELARVRGSDGTLLRTRKGLFTTREVNRDENRIRGAQISEPVLWRTPGRR